MDKLKRLYPAGGGWVSEGYLGAIRRTGLPRHPGRVRRRIGFLGLLLTTLLLGRGSLGADGRLSGTHGFRWGPGPGFLVLELVHVIHAEVR